MNTDETYQYPRVAEAGEIRLFLLQPSKDFKATIRCSLIYTTLKECKYDIINHYNAVSYVWGNQHDRRIIYVDNRTLSITASLDCALRHIRDSEHVLRLWANGICIDQSSIEDRNQQVVQMRDIYSLAQHTIIFLGEGFPEMESVFEVVAAGLPLSFPTDPGDPRSFYRKLDAFRGTRKTSVLSRPWFRRVWVLQELVLSPNPWVQCGKHRVAWDSLCRSLVNQSHPSETNMRLLTDMWNTRLRHIREKNTIFGEGNAGPAENLLQIMSSRRGLGVTDPRDMVYAHLGITGINTEIPSTATKEPDTGYQLPKLTIDYAKSFEQVSLEVTTYLMHNIPASEMLLHVEYPVDRNRWEGLLSWVPDWTIAWEHKYEIPTPEAKRRDRENAQAGPFSTLPWGLGNSLAVPGVLAAVGMRRGIITHLVFRPDLNWDRKAGWEEQEGQLLRWVMNSTNQEEVQTTLATVIAYHKTIFSLGYSKDFYAGEERWSQYPLNETLCRRFEPMIAELRHQRPLGESEEQFQRNVTQVLIWNLVLLVGATKVNLWPDEFQMALLNSGEYIPVSLSSRVGDVVCSFPESRDCFVLRPRELSPLVTEQNHLIKDDFGKHKTLEPSVSDIEHFEFMGPCLRPDPYEFVGLSGEPAKPMIFAIH